MRRREFITLVCVAATWPARAQQSERARRIAVLMNNAEDDPEGQTRAAAFRQGLQALGWTEGKNLRIDWYWTAGDVKRVRGDVAELAQDAPDIIVANGRVILSEAVKVIRSIPIVFVLVNDPVGQGFISSLARPGGNVTGFTFVEYAMFGKSLELLKKVAPAVMRVGFIFNPDMSAYYDKFLPVFERPAPGGEADHWRRRLLRARRERPRCRVPPRMVMNSRRTFNYLVGACEQRWRNVEAESRLYVLADVRLIKRTNEQALRCITRAECQSQCRFLLLPESGCNRRERKSPCSTSSIYEYAPWPSPRLDSAPPPEPT